MEEEIKNIIPFVKSSDLKSRRLSVEKERFNPCVHKNVELVQSTKTVNCADCGQVTTSWDFLFHAAKREDAVFSNIKYAQMELDRIEERVKELKEVLKSTKGKVNRILVKLANKKIELSKL